MTAHPTTKGCDANHYFAFAGNNMRRALTLSSTRDRWPVTRYPLFFLRRRISACLQQRFIVARRDSGNVTVPLSLAMLTVPVAMLAAWLSGAPLATHEPVAQAPVVQVAPQRFEAAQVDEMARRLSQEPPRPVPSIEPQLRDLSYVQYRAIRPRPDQVWKEGKTPIRIDVLPAGSLYSSPVRVSVVENGFATELSGNAASFDLGNEVPQALHGKTLPLSGFRLRTQINTRGKWDEFLVFQGASYFRAVGRDQWYGLSARGLALRTGEPQGEEFPLFSQFWVEKPAPDAKAIVVHALLESPSVTGAYHFTITPGAATVMAVRYTLFPRVDLTNVGIAPLTSMFMFDSSNQWRFEDFRYRVHDSDGLMFESRGGEQAWRQLANPQALQISTFTTEQPRAFGLMQRASDLAEFQDLEAHYEKRPSAWVEFDDAATPGELRLVEIPTRYEVSDNIVAYWSPKQVLPAGQQFSGSYRLSWTAEARVPRSTGRFVAARMGHTTGGERKLFVLDLAGASMDAEGLQLQVTSSAGQVSHPTLQQNPLVKGLRASFEFDPQGASLSEFRAAVVRDGKPVSETWLYRWTD
jgi:glucans biosynthesis protein